MCERLLRDAELDSGTARGRYQPTTPIPLLRLQGRWLDEAGFVIGANVRVDVSAGRLVVEVTERTQEQPSGDSNSTRSPT